MVLHTILSTSHTTDHTLKALAMRLGYHNPKKGVIQLRKFIHAGSIDAWLESDMYDFKHTALTFVKALALELKVDISNALEHSEKKKLRAIALSKLYVEIEVDFQRTSEQIMVLIARQNQRIIRVDTHLLVDKEDSEIFNIYVTKIKEHYQNTKGDLGIWGKVHGYTYYHINGTKYSYAIDDLT